MTAREEAEKIAKDYSMAPSLADRITHALERRDAKLALAVEALNDAWTAIDESLYPKTFDVVDSAITALTKKEE